MSCLEAIGALAATSQLALYLKDTLESIEALRNELRNGPHRISEQAKYLTALISVLEVTSAVLPRQPE